MSDLLIPLSNVEAMVHCRFGSSFIFVDEIFQWFIENDYQYQCFNEYTITEMQFWIRASDEILIAFKLRWL